MVPPAAPSPASAAPVLLWLRRELRVHDNPALAAAVASGRPVLPVFVLDDETPGAWKLGGAARWWLHHSLSRLGEDLRARGAKLLLRRGKILDEIARLVMETGAAEIHAGVAVEPWARRVEADLRETLGARLRLHRTNTLFEMDGIRTQGGGAYHVFTPFSRACLARGGPDAAIAAPRTISGATPPPGDALDDWKLLPTTPDWTGGLRETWTPGEAGGGTRLRHVAAAIVGRYDQTRNFPGQDGTSMLSPHLHWGELSPGQVWRAARRTGDGPGVATFVNELLWREFSAHLLWHYPDLPETPLRREFSGMPWEQDPAALRAWQRGRTGIPIVDAGMRQLWHTGWMHNRVRMIVASFLVKHLLIPWQAGEAWFWDTLVDADLASNAAQWQWVAGCGADAAPYFRVFNPVLQGQKFDGDGVYVRRWVPELAEMPVKSLHAPWEAPEVARPKNYPAPIVDLAAGRERALNAFRLLPRSAA